MEDFIFFSGQGCNFHLFIGGKNRHFHLDLRLVGFCADKTFDIDLALGSSDASVECMLLFSKISAQVLSPSLRGKLYSKV